MTSNELGPLCCQGFSCNAEYTDKVIISGHSPYVDSVCIAKVYDQTCHSLLMICWLCELGHDNLSLYFFIFKVGDSSRYPEGMSGGLEKRNYIQSVSVEPNRCLFQCTADRGGMSEGGTEAQSLRLRNVCSPHRHWHVPIHICPSTCGTMVRGGKGIGSKLRGVGGS